MPDGFRLSPGMLDKDAIEKALCEKSFYHFLKYAWPDIDPATFVDGWHLKVICSELEKVERGEIRNIVINIPPRHAKSLVISVAFPAWVWARDPSAQFIATSYAAALSTRDSVKMRRLVEESDWYRKHWGDKVMLKHDQNQKQSFATTAGGSRFSTSVTGQLTGYGCSYFICLPYESIVITENGRERIGDVVRDERSRYILGYDHDIGKSVFKLINKYETNPGNDLIEINIDNGFSIKCTCDHPVYVVGRGYIRADMVRENDEVLVCRDFYTL